MTRRQNDRHKKQLPLKWKLFIYLAALCAFIIALLWVSQIVFLDDFYYNITLGEMRSASTELSSVDESELETEAALTGQRHDVCVMILGIKSGEASRLASYELSSSCLIHHITSSTISELYRTATENGGEAVSSLTPTAKGEDIKKNADPVTPPEKPADDSTEPDGVTPPDGTDKRSFGAANSTGRMIYTRVFDTEDGQRVVMLDCALTPVSSIKHTLTVQLSVVSVILALTALLLAFFLSRRISRPLQNMGASARELARGDYSVSFDGRGCRETAELADTLGYAANELSKLDKMQKELIANISHDLRTPLTMIEGYSEVMRDIPGENTPENVQVIIDETKRLTSLVNEMLEISRFNEGKRTLHRERMSLTALLSDTVERFVKLNECRGFEIKLEAEADADISADRTQITQCLYNLLGNAVNHAGEDKTVTVRQTVSGGRVRVDVIDCGEGIAADQLPNIWDRYYKIDEPHRRATVGSGIGLSIVKEVLAAHGAKFGVSSTVGAGSDFWFEMPLVND